MLAGTVELSTALYSTEHALAATLAVLPSGAYPTSLNRHVTAERVHEVFDQLGAMFDLVVVDTPPVNLLGDAMLLAADADAVVLVARAGKTRAEALQYAVAQLDSMGVTAMGVALNDVDFQRNLRDDSAYGYLSRGRALLRLGRVTES